MVLPISYAPQSSTFGSRLGESLGTGISEGLAALANMKLQQYAQQQQAQRYATGLQGLFPFEQAQALSQLPPELLAPVIKEQARGARQLQTTGPGLQTIAPELSEDQATKIGRLPASVQNLWFKEYQDNPQAAIDRLNRVPSNFGNKQVQKFAKELQSAAKQEPLNKELLNAAQQQQLKNIPQQNLAALSPQAASMNQIQQAINAGAQQAQPIAPVAAQASVAGQPIEPEISPTEQEKIRKKKLLEEPIKSITQRVKEGEGKKSAEKSFDADVKERNQLRKEKQTKLTQSQKFRQDTQALDKISEQNIHDLERMSEKNAEGKLDTAGYNEFLKRSGLDIPALLTADSQEFDKLATGFMRGLKEITRGTINKFEVEQFMKTIPSLSQSPEGRNRVLAQLLRINRINKLYYPALREVMKENDNDLPDDFFEQVYDRVGAQMDPIAQQFVEDINRPVPEAQNPYVTALQAGAGNAVGFLPGALKTLGKTAASAYAGYKVGKYFGPHAGTAGAVIGALFGKE